MNDEKIRIDLGCGKNKKHGFIGLDKIAMSGVDIVCDLNKEKMPIDDSSVDEIFSMHFMEHVFNLPFVMEEVWRICKNKAKVTIAVPYFSAVGAFCDPTHKQFFTFDTFDYFADSKKYPSFYSKIKFRIVKKKLLFYPSNSNIYGKIRFLHMIPFQIIANLAPYFYEHSLFKLFSPRDLYVELEVIK